MSEPQKTDFGSNALKDLRRALGLPAGTSVTETLRRAVDLLGPVENQPDRLIAQRNQLAWELLEMKAHGRAVEELLQYEVDSRIEFRLCPHCDLPVLLAPAHLDGKCQFCREVIEENDIGPEIEAAEAIERCASRLEGVEAVLRGHQGERERVLTVLGLTGNTTLNLDMAVRKAVSDADATTADNEDLLRLGELLGDERRSKMVDYDIRLIPAAIIYIERLEAALSALIETWGMLSLDQKRQAMAAAEVVWPGASSVVVTAVQEFQQLIRHTDTAPTGETANPGAAGTNETNGEQPAHDTPDGH